MSFFEEFRLADFLWEHGPANICRRPELTSVSQRLDLASLLQGSDLAALSRELMSPFRKSRLADFAPGRGLSRWIFSGDLS